MPMNAPPPRPSAPPTRAGVVLSGGGARGAYEVGVMAGVIDVLGLSRTDAPPFRVFTGTSVGAINAAFLAAHVDRGDLNVGGLMAVWRGLRLPVHVRLDPLRLFGLRRLASRWLDPDHLGPSLLDPDALDAVVANAIPWDRLHANARSGALHALVIAALEVASGRTTLFHETGPECTFRASRDPRRRSWPGPIEAAQVLASSAIPLVFPARRVGDAWFCDGSLRFNTPIAPCIRAGADRLLVVSLQHQRAAPPVAQPESSYPNPLFLLGKVLNALLLDPVAYDLQVLRRFNRMVEVLDETLPPAERARVDAVMAQGRGLPYRRVEPLVFYPSADLGELAARHLQAARPAEVGRLGRWLLARASAPGATWEDDLASYILFDGAFAESLMTLGRDDVHARAEEVRRFFSPERQRAG